VAERLQDRELGDGVVFRVAKQVQQELFEPPDDGHRQMSR
jgi:hypothetical protein